MTNETNNMLLFAGGLSLCFSTENTATSYVYWRKKRVKLPEVNNVLPLELLPLLGKIETVKLPEVPVEKHVQVVGQTSKCFGVARPGFKILGERFRKVLNGESSIQW